MKIMKMRKQLKKLETMKKLNLDDSEVKKLLTDIAEFSKDGKQEKTDKNIIINDEHLDVKSEKNQEESLNINDFISSSNISMDKWNALESKFMEELGGMNYDSYESPYMDEEESNLMEHEDKYENLQEKMEKILKDANKKEEKVTDTEKSLTEINNPIGQGTKESEDEIVFLESCVERIEEMNMRNISDGAVEGRKLQKEKMFSVPSAVNIEEKVEKTAEIENFENIAQDVEVTIQNIGETNENIEELTMDVEETNENNDAITENIVENILIEETTENIEEITENIEEITENCDEITENFEITEDVEVTIGNVEGISESLEIIENVTINSKEKSDNTEEKQINPVGNVENAKDNIEKTNMNSESKTNKHIPEGERQTEKELEQIELITDNPSIEEFNELHLNADQNRKNQHALILESSETEQVSLEHKLVFPESHSSKSCQTKRRDSKSPIKPMEADFKRKIIVLLEKHSLTEEMIQRRKNGEHSVESNLADIEVELSTKGKSVEVLEIEKENIQSNKIMLLDNIGLEGESTSLKISGQNHVNNRCRKTLLDNKYEVYAEKVESSRENYDKTRTDITNEEMFHRNITNNCESGSKEEDLCCSLESTHNERGLFILRTLIKSIEDNISQSSKKNYSIDLSQAENTHTRKRKLNEDRCDISNNNLDDTVSKKLRIKNTSTTLVPNKTVSTSKKKKIEERKEIPDISSEENFVLPLSPAESEPCIEQKRDAEIVQTPSRRQSGLKSDDSRKKDEISLVTKKSTVCKNNTENKNSAKQRYSSEDLYKPRMLLRRSAKGSKILDPIFYF
ncbi:hypothetical protein HHI36_008643 [Cryptolaemus montrouzieri]|uniref:Uncharacterized protein n=1 Tax=Cryptolaemus montrouzieri TaxID=559131 RepID=A0ABD2MT60_9CUCU